MGFRTGPLAGPSPHDLRAASALRGRKPRGSGFGRHVEDGDGTLREQQHLQRRHLRCPQGDSWLGSSRLRRRVVGRCRGGGRSVASARGPAYAGRTGRTRNRARGDAVVRRYGLRVRLRRQHVGRVPPERRRRAGHHALAQARRTAQGQRPGRNGQYRHLFLSAAGRGVPDRLLYAPGRRPRNVRTRFHVPRIPLRGGEGRPSRPSGKRRPDGALPAYGRRACGQLQLFERTA